MPSNRLTKGRLRPVAKFPDLGRLDVCLTVADLAAATGFYETLGFAKVEGQSEKGWAVLARGSARIGLFKGYISENTLNFRAGHIGELLAAARKAGLAVEGVVDHDNPHCGSFTVRDPDGNQLFFDTAPEEI